nr:hypothetical protein Iba_scaffold10073CG0130 [Ipomoea batatas]
MAVDRSLQFGKAVVLAVMIGGGLRPFYGFRSIWRSPVEAAFGVGNNGCFGGRCCGEGEGGG